MNHMFSVFLLVSCYFFATTWADTPANCTHDDLLGTWNFYFSEGGHDKTLDCSNPGMYMILCLAEQIGLYFSLVSFTIGHGCI